MTFQTNKCWFININWFKNYAYFDFGVNWNCTADCVMCNYVIRFNLIFSKTFVVMFERQTVLIYSLPFQFGLFDITLIVLLRLHNVM